MSRGIGILVVGMLCLLFFSACRRQGNETNTVDMLNEKSYAFHYRDLDSTLHYAKEAYALAEDYGAGRAEAINNLAFVDIARMEYERADSLLNTISNFTDNQVELLIADVQMMRLCQRMSSNRRFYDYRVSAVQRLRRIKEEPSELSPHLERRMVYAESEMAIVTSTYYYYLGQRQKSSRSLLAINQETIKQDTAQYLNYLYNIGAGGILTGNVPEEIVQREFEHLVGCLMLARKSGDIYFEANAIEAISDHLLDKTNRSMLISNNPAAMQIINPTGYDVEDIAGELAVEALELFSLYGDTYQTAGAYRSLASCYMGIGDYYSAIDNLHAAIEDSIIEKAPDLVASIREQMSVAYSAIDDKPSSDYNRNIYLDMQEETRQDRQLEARAAMLEKESRQLSILIVVVVLMIVALITLLWIFNRLYRKRNIEEETNRLLLPLRQWSKDNAALMAKQHERYEEIVEQTEVCRINVADNEKQNLEQRARISLATSILPFIDRIINEVRMLRTRNEDDDVRRYRRQYIEELTDQINDNNNLLTQWIKLSEGRLSIKVGSFRLNELFDIIGKNRTTFNAKGIELEVKPTEAVVKADRVLTLFMINTLADNARKFTPSGGKVCIYATQQKDYVEISVSDTGSGLTEEQTKNIFNRKVSDGHGFGLMNCRGIIEKYRKTSPKFSVAMLSVDSELGKGSRFFFRLPTGVARCLLAFAFLVLSVSAAFATDNLSDLRRAADFADSAYYSNIAGTYGKTIEFADSCRRCLNRHYRNIQPKGNLTLTVNGNAAIEAPEVKWLRSGIDVDYNVILDMRNECAVAALALHDWGLYKYNNTVYTSLFNALSADNTLADYCSQMRSSQTNKTIAIIVLILLLIAILPAYYMLYYRHRLYFKFCEERIGKINEVLNGDGTAEEKLKATERLAHEDFPEQLQRVVDTIRQTLKEAIAVQKRNISDLETAEDQLHRTEYENNNLHVCNSILDNCLSTLKHETMYYPSRIRQMMLASSVDDVAEVVDYYRQVYAMLCTQAAQQLDKTTVTMRKHRVADIVGDTSCKGDSSLLVVCNKNLVSLLLDILRQQTSDGNIAIEVEGNDLGYVRFMVSMPGLVHGGNDLQRLFMPVSSQSVPFLLCRQIIRDHSEATNRRGCGIFARQSEDGAVVVEFTLPAAEKVIQ
ncbi:MAG: DUF5112 domain-containing protein [Prevotella sp.]